MLNRSRASWRHSRSAILTLLAVGPAAAWAQAGPQGNPPTAADQTVVTVAARLPVALQSQAADVVVITRSDLDSMAADNLADVLQQRAGVQISRTGGTGQPTSALLRGASASNTVVLVDGVRVGSATTGQFDFSTLALAGIERIEVLRGPGSSLHGADAVGGVVLITTRAPGTAGGIRRASLAAGSLGSSDAQAAASTAGTDWDLRVSASRQASQGVSALRPGDAFGNHNPDADGYRRQALQVAGRWQPVAGQRVEAGVLRTDLLSRYDGAEYRPPTYAPDASPDFRTETRTEALHLRGDGALRGDWSWRARLGRSLDDSTSGANELYRYRTRREDVSLQLAWEPAGHHQWVLAWDAQTERVDASGYAGPTRRDNDAWTVAYSGRWGAVQLQADARLDRNSVYGDHATGRTGLRWALGPQTRLRLLAASTFRAPGFNELFFPGYGVASLRPEEGRSLEAGVDHRMGPVQWQATAWRNRVDNLIGYSGDAARCPATAAYAFGCAANIAQARLQGLTLEGRWTAPGSTGRTPPWSWGYDYTDARDGEGRPLPRRARHQARLQTDHDWGAWRMGASFLWMSPRQESQRVLRGRSRLDLQAARRLGGSMVPAGAGAGSGSIAGWSLRLRMLNALNADFEPAADYRSPGRQFWVGLHWEGR